MLTPHNQLKLPRPLGDGLVLRLGTPADAGAVAEFNERIMLEEDEPAGIFSSWTLDMMSGNHPTVSAADVVLVEDTSTGRIVSSTVLIPQVWSYAGIQFPAGRPELVATDPAYRRRGLVRAIFGAIHELSAAYGHLLQAITGIYWFYRQFGYEYAIARDRGRSLSVAHVPDLAGGESERFHIRPATEADTPTLARLYARYCATKLVSSVLTAERWRYDLFGVSPESAQAIKVFCLVDNEARVVGYYTTSGHFWDNHLQVWELIPAEDAPLRAMLPAVLRAFKRQGEAMAPAAKPKPEKMNGIRFWLDPEHPVFELLAGKLSPPPQPYAFYIRVPDVPAFIRHITPALEQRLAGSVMSGYSGKLPISFYRGGLRLVFEQGRLVEATNWRPPESDQHWDGAGFPPLVFLQLLFGHRSLDELRHAFPDCWAGEESALLLNALFPKQTSWVLPLG